MNEVAAPLPLTKKQAEKLDGLIRAEVQSLREGWTYLQQLLSQAAASNLHDILGYPHWSAYLVDVFDDSPMRLGKEERDQAIEFMAGELNMSGAAMSALLGVNRSTISRIREKKGIGGQGKVIGLDGKERLPIQGKKRGRPPLDEGPMQRILLRTRHPQDYELLNVRTGQRWRIKGAGWHSLADGSTPSD